MSLEPLSQEQQEYFDKNWITVERDMVIKQKTGIDRQQAILDGTCAVCKEALGEFRDAISKREAAISRTCQKCQDGIFSA